MPKNQAKAMHCKHCEKITIHSIKGSTVRGKVPKTKTCMRCGKETDI